MTLESTDNDRMATSRNLDVCAALDSPDNDRMVTAVEFECAHVALDSIDNDRMVTVVAI